MHQRAGIDVRPPRGKVIIMKALIVYGGWEGHEPEAVSKIFADGLGERGFQVELSQSLDVFLDVDKLKGFDLIVTHWTMGTITGEQVTGLVEAVRSGVGFAGVHGGAGDAFRGEPSWQLIVGGQFVSHGPISEYEVRVVDKAHPITAGIDFPFKYTSEQYYMHVDPAIHVLAETPYEFDGRTVNMPCLWTKTFGAGRVFYCSLGHVAKEFSDYPQVLEMIMRGMVWSAEGKRNA